MLASNRTDLSAPCFIAEHRHMRTGFDQRRSPGGNDLSLFPIGLADKRIPLPHKGCRYLLCLRIEFRVGVHSCRLDCGRTKFGRAVNKLRLVFIVNWRRNHADYSIRVSCVSQLQSAASWTQRKALVTSEYNNRRYRIRQSLQQFSAFSVWIPCKPLSR